MTRTQLCLAVIIVSAAAACGGGGAAVASAATPAPSYALLAFDINGTDPGTPATFDIEQGHTAWSASYQTAGNAEALRVRLYLSHDDILDGAPATSGGSSGPDVMFYDATVPAGAPSPATLSCTYDANRLLSCGSDSAHALDRDSWVPGFDVDAFIIARVCSSAAPGHCDSWPVPVHFHD